MTLERLVELTNGKLRARGAERDITCGYSCDLLSWVMARGAEGCCWVTIQTHMNVIAVASLHDMACIVIPEGAVMPDDCVLKAQEQGIAVVETALTAYSVCGLLHDDGIPSANE